MAAKPGQPMRDASRGWDAAAGLLIEHRAQSPIGVDVLRDWATRLPAGASILDLGCGAGAPVSSTLVDLGFQVAGIDGSPRLVEASRARVPRADVRCEPAETSAWFGRTFDAIVAIGLLFLNTEATQRAVIAHAGPAIRAGGRLLVTAPWQTATWIDPTTGLECRSLGRAEYVRAFERAGFVVDAMPTDDGENHYYSAVRG
jgi:SAM-dependent methyltransferase